MNKEPTGGKVIDSAPTDSFTANGTYGTLTIDSVTHEATYTPKTMKFTDIDTFWLLTQISITTNEGTVNKYAYEEVKVVPTQSLYFEDDFEQDTADGITFTDSPNCGTTDYGKWKTTTSSPAQELEESIGGYDGCIAYSNNKAHTVAVSDALGKGQNIWPKAEFTFAGTGFDIISTTDSMSGVFVVTVKDGSGKQVTKKYVDTYYGYTYSLLYYDTATKKIVSSADGTQPLYLTVYDQNNIPDDGAKYVKDISGKVYTTDSSKGKDGTQAYGWLISDSNTETMYQVPVLAYRADKYDTYTVTVEARFTTMFGHYSTDADGNNFYNLIFDAVRIYDPAGDSDKVQEAYEEQGNGNISYVELRDYLNGSDEEGTIGYVLIDGNRAVKRSEVPNYKKVSPNNELYLSGNQAIAFEIDLGSCKDIQIGMREVNSASTSVTISNGDQSKDKNIVINSATEKYYSLVECFGNSFNGTVTISNNGSGVLSLTSIKTIATPSGGDSAAVLPCFTPLTAAKAESMLMLNETDLSINPEDVKTETNGDLVVLTVKTSDDVKSLRIKDENGNVVDNATVESFAGTLEDENVTTWRVTLTKAEDGEYAYSLKGLNEFGFEKDEETMVSFCIGGSDIPTQDGNITATLFAKLQGLFERIIEFVNKLIAILNINF